MDEAEDELSRLLESLNQVPYPIASCKHRQLRSLTRNNATGGASGTSFSAKTITRRRRPRVLDLPRLLV